MLECVSHGRVALKQGFYTVNHDSRDAKINLDALSDETGRRFDRKGDASTGIAENSVITEFRMSNVTNREVDDNHELTSPTDGNVTCPALHCLHRQAVE